MYDDYYYDDSALAVGSVALFIYALVIIALSVAMCVAMWKLFKKAGYQGWESLVPIYSAYVLSDIVFGNGLYFLICFIPVVGWIYPLVLYFKLAEVYNKSSAFGLGLVFLSPIFLLLLAFDSNLYYSGPSSRAVAAGYGSYGAGSYGNDVNGYNNDYPTYGGNNPQGYPNNGYNQQGFNYQQDYQNGGYQNNGFQNNGFQTQGQPQNNPFENIGNDNYYGNNSNYSGYNNQQNDENNNNGFGGF